jgi:hypothetical protein
MTRLSTVTRKDEGLGPSTFLEPITRSTRPEVRYFSIAASPK